MDNEMTAFLAGQNSTDRNNCYDGMGFGGGWFIWIILIFAIFMGNGFGGWGNNGALQGALTRGEMADGFNTAEILRNQNGLMRDQFGVQRDVLENRYNTQLGLAGLDKSIMENRFASQQCCCETNRNIDSVRYDAQKNTCDITTAIHAEGEATRALIQKNEMQNLRDRLQQMELREAMCGVVRYPMATTYTSGGNPFCGCNNGCNI